MKRHFVILASAALTFAACQNAPKEDYSWIKNSLDVASAQLMQTAEEIDGTGKFPGQYGQAIQWISFAVNWNVIPLLLKIHCG